MGQHLQAAATACTTEWALHRQQPRAAPPAPATPPQRAWFREGSQVPNSQRMAATKEEPNTAVPARSLPLWGTRLQGAEWDGAGRLGASSGIEQWAPAASSPAQGQTLPASCHPASGVRLYRKSSRMRLDRAMKPRVPPVSLQAAPGRGGVGPVQPLCACRGSGAAQFASANHERGRLLLLLLVPLVPLLPLLQASRGAAINKQASYKPHLNGVDSLSTPACQKRKAPSAAASRRQVASSSTRASWQVCAPPPPARAGCDAARRLCRLQQAS